MSASLNETWDSRSNCFGCSETNDIGLKLSFDDHATHVSTPLLLGRAYESYPGIVHGGIVSTVLDECMGRAIMVFTGKMAVTMGLRVRFIGICESDRPYQASGHILSTVGNIIKAEARIVTADGHLIAIGEASWMVIEANDALSGKSKVPPRTLGYIKQELDKNGACCERT